MKKESKGLLLVSSVFVVFALSSQSASAEVKVRGGVANTNFSLEYINIFNNGDVKAQLLTKTLGVTLIGESGVYLDLSGSRGDVNNSTSTFISAPQMKINSRTDAAFNIGNTGTLESGKGYSYFIGYKTGETLATGYNSSLTSTTNDKYSTTGYVVGGGMSFPLEIGGALGLNIAAARLTTIWSDDASFSASNDTSGFSVGWSYNYPLSSTYTIAVDGKSNVYRYTFQNCKNQGYSCQVSEIVTSLGATLSAQF